MVPLTRPGGGHLLALPHGVLDFRWPRTVATGVVLICQRGTASAKPLCPHDLNCYGNNQNHL